MMKALLLQLMMICSLASCSKMSIEEEFNFLKIKEVLAEATGTETRAALFHTTFPEGSNIGVLLFQNSDGAPFGTVAKWTKNGNSWTTSIPIDLVAAPCTAYAYYPYDPSVADITDIPVKYDLSDYMCAMSDRTDISNVAGKNTISFVMKHIMTRVGLRVRKDISYIGAGELTYAGVRNAPMKSVMPTDPSLIRFNAKTGAVTLSGLPTVHSGLELKEKYNTPIPYPVRLTTSTPKGVVGEMITAPFTFETGDIEFFLIIDGVEYIVPIPKPAEQSIATANGGWNTGHNYRYTLTLKPRHVSINGIVVNDWVEL